MLKWLYAKFYLKFCHYPNIIKCGFGCRQSYIRTAIAHPEWSKSVWEEIAKRVLEEKTK